MHLTITDGETDGLPAFIANVVDAGAPANEIETTFEMIEAGENVLLEELGAFSRCFRRISNRSRWCGAARCGAPSSMRGKSARIAEKMETPAAKAAREVAKKATKAAAKTKKATPAAE
jgi:hypothetical protein